MAIIKCPECGKEFSSLASVCPVCAAPTELILKILQEKKKKQEQGTSGPFSEHKENVHCPVCGNINKVKTKKVCSKCGYPLLSFCKKQNEINQVLGSYRREYDLKNNTNQTNVQIHSRKNVKCVICGTEYIINKMSSCPYCHYPVFTFSRYKSMVREMVNLYQIKNGIIDPKALNWDDPNFDIEKCRRAVEQGNTMAQYNLGKCYANGRDVAKDYSEAIKWYRESAAQGYANAQYQLGRCYEYGEGVPVSLYKAFQWYRQSAEQGDADAQNRLADFYYYGRGVKKDTTKAVNWYRMSAERGNAEAQYNLGNCYKDGLGVEKDIFEAVRWYRKSAEQGNDSGQGALGWCYLKGLGVPMDKSESSKWYRLASESRSKRQKIRQTLK